MAFDGANTFSNESIDFHSRRSPIFSKYGMVASSQPLASQIGHSILKENGNAIDACIAMNAALSVVEPCSTGLGGDCMVLYYHAKDRKVYALNGSGRSAANCTLANYVQTLCDTTQSDAPRRQFERDEEITIDPTHALHVTVPGNVAGMFDLLHKYGTMSRERVLLPAIDLAQNGFVVGPITSYLWQQNVGKLIAANDVCPGLTVGSHATRARAPKTGELMKNPYIADTLRKLMVHGKQEYYSGSIADRIVDVVQKQGGLLTREDLRQHTSTFVDPIKIRYKNVVDIYEIPPNGQGLAALMALNFYQQKQSELLAIDSSADPMNAYVRDLHLKTECMRLSYRYAQQFIADLSFKNNREIEFQRFLSERFTKQASKQISWKSVNREILSEGVPLPSSDTVGFCAVDRWGNGCSFLSSNYMDFGTGIMPRNCGFTLQNRGYNFVRRVGHPNSLDANKRPYHTIIPGIATRADNGELYATFNVMGGFMQPQGHLQVISNMVDKGMNPQQALDAPRFCIRPDLNTDAPQLKDKWTTLLIEDQGNAESITEELRQVYGHEEIAIVRGHQRKVFGRGQIIYRDPSSGVLWAGSDPRADGCAYGLTSKPKIANL